MKLGMLIPEFPTQTHIFFWREIEALRELGVEVHLLSTRRPTETCPHPFAAAAAVETHYLHPPSPGAVLALALHPAGLARAARYVGSLSGRGMERARALALIPAAAELLRQARRVGLDHVHVHSCAAAAHVAALSRSLGGPRYSLHLHGDLPVYGSDHAQKSALASFVAAAARPMQQQLIEQAGLPAERTCTLTMGVDTRRFVPAAAPSPGPLRVLTVARLNRAKGHRYALEAVRVALDAGVQLHYRIAGSGPHRDEIEAEVRRLGIEGHVSMLGSLSEDGVLAELQRSDVFVLPTVGIGEASPVAVMEAMASGVPVVASRVGGTPDMITDGVDGVLVDQADVPALASSLGRLWRDVGLRRALGEAARGRAVAQFDSRARAQCLLDEIARCGPLTPPVRGPRVRSTAT